MPSLSFLAGVGVHEAIPACMLSYLATGAVGAIVFARHGSIQWGMAFWVCVGAVPAAYIGATTLLSIPGYAVKLLIATLMIFAGIDSLRKSGDKPKQNKAIGRFALISIGFVTGFGSAITGTGGPLILVPLIIFLGLPVLTAVGLSQAVQIPIAAFASLGNWAQGNLNVTLGLTIAAAMVVGSLVGATLVHRVPTEPVKKTVACLLVVVGGGIGWQVLSSFANS